MLSADGVQFPQGGGGKQYKISIGDLSVQAEVGRGQFGVVSRVQHRPSGIIMAMKQIRLDISDAASRQILMELQVLHQANSEYIIDFYGAFFAESNVYLCVEYMDAGSLGEMLAAHGAL